MFLVWMEFQWCFWLRKFDILISLQTIIHCCEIISIIISFKLWDANTMANALFTLLNYNSNRKQMQEIWMALSICIVSEEEIVNILWVNWFEESRFVWHFKAFQGQSFVSNNAWDHFSLNSQRAVPKREYKEISFTISFPFRKFYSFACIFASLHCFTDISSIIAIHKNCKKKRKLLNF